MIIAAGVFIGLGLGMLLGNQNAWLMLCMGIAFLLKNL